MSRIRNVNIETLLCSGWDRFSSSIHDETKVYNIFSSSIGPSDNHTSCYSPIEQKKHTHCLQFHSPTPCRFSFLFWFAFFCHTQKKRERTRCEYERAMYLFFFCFIAWLFLVFHSFLNVWNFDLFQTFVAALLSSNFLSTSRQNEFVLLSFFFFLFVLLPAKINCLATHKKWCERTLDLAVGIFGLLCSKKLYSVSNDI